MVFSILYRIKKVLLLVAVATVSLIASAQHFAENLDRGLVAVQTGNGNFLSWRIPGTEWYNVTYNVYRDGTKLNETPLAVSNYSDTSGSPASAYTVTAIINGKEQSACPAETPWSKQYKEIRLKPRNTTNYEINDGTAADLDGDGQYEIIIKRMNGDWTAENDSLFTYFEAYKQDGTLMWEINVGPNIMSSSGVEINIAAFDFDNDGKAEVYMRTSEGTIFGDGTLIGDTDGDGKTNYRYSVLQSANMQYMQAGPEFLSLIDGETGAELDRVDFIPRISSGWWYPEAPTKAYGHRANKFFFGAPYLDGVHPSLFIGRGIYTKTVMRTYDVVNKKLVKRWEWSATDTSSPYYAQGNHNYTIADVDGDGRDEIVWGSMTVDDNGTGLYSTRLGHGDALHVGDFDPYHKGTEIFKCLENNPVWGTVLYDGATGEILLHDVVNDDCGRCMAANVSNDFKGAEVWGGNYCFSATTLQPVNSGGSVNFRIFWDGDLLDELLDKQGTYDSPGIIQKGEGAVIFTATGTLSCNYTKATPTLQADLFGDWREEVIWRKDDNTAIRIYTTTDPTIYRNYTLMHDPQYRQAINWQMCGYNQPPHVSYFLGELEGKTLPPPPSITNERLQYQGGGVWDKITSTAWLKDGVATAFADGDKVLFDATNGAEGTTTTVTLAETISPELIAVNSPGNYVLNASDGKITGNTIMTKMGAGTCTLTGTHDFTGATEVWGGRLNVNGGLSQSPVLLEFFGEMGAKGTFNNLKMRYGSMLYVGTEDSSGTATFQNLDMEEGSSLIYDLYAPGDTKNDSLVINGNLSFADKVTFTIHPVLEAGKAKLDGGEYLLAKVNGTITGNIENAIIDGILGTPAELKIENGNIYLVVSAVRSSTSIYWNGDKTGAAWDLAITDNFLVNNSANIFVDGDSVVFNDNAVSKTVNIAGAVTPSSIVVDAASDYIFNGPGSITGTTTLTKKGNGTLTINNTNDFNGKVSIMGGKVVVPKIASSLEAGALGATSTAASDFVINGGTLCITAASSAERALTIGADSATLQTNAKVNWTNLITGETLIKTGSGELVLAAANTQKNTIIRNGKVTLYDNDATPGKAVVFENGSTLQDFDNTGSYRTSNWDMEVTDGNSGIFNMNSAATYTGTLTGNGTLSVNIPYVRSTISGNWSAFTGTIHFNSTYTKGTAQLRLNNSAGLPNASVVVNSAFHSGTKTMNPIAISFGALSGTGSLAGFPGITVGAKNSDCTFSGILSNGTNNDGSEIKCSLVKEGSGTFTLSGANTYTSGTTVKTGILSVNNTTGSGTGTGKVTVLSGAKLTGKGIITGEVAIESGATLAPGATSVGQKLTIENNLTLKSGSTMEVKTNPLFGYVDQIIVAGQMSITCALTITNTTTTDYKNGDEFKLIDCPSVSGKFTSITPATPGENLAWDVSELYSKGVIKVVSTVSASNMGTTAVRLYPNPASNWLNIQLNEQGSESIVVSIYNITGKLELNEVLSNETVNPIDIRSLAEGTYFVKIVQDKQLYGFKISVIR